MFDKAGLLRARLALFLALLLESAPTIAAPAAPTAPLNDTGLRRCLVQGSLIRDCGGTGQDAQFGRDVERPRDPNGAAGFAFVKIDAAGAALPADASDWRCVFDRVTGRLWERKTDDGGPHDSSNVYTMWGDGLEGDVLRLVRSTNRERLCGFDDWRVPSRSEMLGILHFDRPWNRPAVDERWFPRLDYQYGTATSNADDERQAWTVTVTYGVSIYADARINPVSAMLVRGGAAPSDDRYLPRDDEVVDTRTGLIWRRCVEGQPWDGAACAGTALSLHWNEALDRARAAADRSGVAWRMPNVKEAESLIEDSHVKPALDPVFPRSGGGTSMWTSTFSREDEGLRTTVFHVDDWFASVFPSTPDSLGKLRLVRDAR